MTVTTPLKLIIFDVDGTLIDSQHSIVTSAVQAFEAIGRPPPSRADILGIVGLSLPEAMLALAPDLTQADIEHVVDLYKSSFVKARAQGQPHTTLGFYPGMRELLDALSTTETLLAIATGKSRSGIDHLFESFPIAPYFCATQSADDAPSKPNPGMVHNILKQCGASPEHTVVVGDTSFDMNMAMAAGCSAIGVSWGYHTTDVLENCGAHYIAQDADHLRSLLYEHWT